MNEIERLWAGWRSDYVLSGGKPECVFCHLFHSGLPDAETNVVWRNELVAAVLNAYPYGSGHILVMPVRHIDQLESLSEDEGAALWRAINNAVSAIKIAYTAPGINVGFNLGEAAGAGIPSHLHAHALPRWNADTNFMTSIANTRVLPEPLNVTWQKLRDAWPVP